MEQASPKAQPPMENCIATKGKSRRRLRARANTFYKDKSSHIIRAASIEEVSTAGLTSASMTDAPDAGTPSAQTPEVARCSADAKAISDALDQVILPADDGGQEATPSASLLFTYKKAFPALEPQRPLATKVVVTAPPVRVKAQPAPEAPVTDGKTLRRLALKEALRDKMARLKRWKAEEELAAATAATAVAAKVSPLVVLPKREQHVTPLVSTLDSPARPSKPKSLGSATAATNTAGPDDDLRAPTPAEFFSYPTHKKRKSRPGRLEAKALAAAKHKALAAALASAKDAVGENAGGLPRGEKSTNFSIKNIIRTVQSGVMALFGPWW